MNNNYMIIDGYHFKIKKERIIDILKNLITNNQAICALDSSKLIYKSGEKNELINPDYEVIDFNSYIKSSQVLSEEEKNILLNFNNYFEFEKRMENPDFSILAKMKSIYIKYPNYKDEFKIDIDLVLFLDKRFNYVFNIEFDKNIDPVEFQNTILYSSYEYVKLPIEYKCLIKFANIITKDNHIIIKDSGILDFPLFNMISFFSNERDLHVEQRRSSIFINKENITNKEIHQLLLQTNAKLKEYPDLKDFRIVNDYCHYTNQLMSVIVGKQAYKAMNEIRIMDSEIVNSLLDDQMHINRIEDNSYSLNELLKVQEIYDLQNSFKNHIPLIEPNNYLKYVFGLLNKYDVNNTISNAIERKKTERQSKKEFMISVFGCILAVPVLYEYVIEPLAIYFHNIINTENEIKSIPLPLNIIITISMLLLSFFLLYLFAYRIDNKKEK